MTPNSTNGCPICGHQLRTVEKFCTSCGRPVDELGKKNASLWGWPFRRLRWVLPVIVVLAVSFGLLWVTLANICGCSPLQTQEYLHNLITRSVFDAHNVDQRYNSFDEMTFADLKAMAVEVEYSDLVDDYPDYTYVWLGNVTPTMLYFTRELVGIEDPASLGFKGVPHLWEGIWLGRLRLEDGNVILINGVDPPSSVGDVLELVVVCKELRSDSPLPDCNAIVVNETG